MKVCNINWKMYMNVHIFLYWVGSKFPETVFGEIRANLFWSNSWISAQLYKILDSRIKGLCVNTSYSLAVFYANWTVHTSLRYSRLPNIKRCENKFVRNTPLYCIVVQRVKFTLLMSAQCPPHLFEKNRNES